MLPRFERSGTLCRAGALLWCAPLRVGRVERAEMQQVVVSKISSFTHKGYAALTARLRLSCPHYMSYSSSSPLPVECFALP